jgi:hypothetical protein
MPSLVVVVVALVVVLVVALVVVLVRWVGMLVAEGGVIIAGAIVIIRGGLDVGGLGTIRRIGIPMPTRGRTMLILIPGGPMVRRKFSLR